MSLVLSVFIVLIVFVLLVVVIVKISCIIGGSDCENFLPHLSVLRFLAIKGKQLREENLSYVYNYLSPIIVD